jgi:hypothetical protein
MSHLTGNNPISGISMKNRQWLTQNQRLGQQRDLAARDILEREKAVRDERYLLARSRRLVQEAQARASALRSSRGKRAELAKTESRNHGRNEADGNGTPSGM